VSFSIDPSALCMGESDKEYLSHGRDSWVSAFETVRSRFISVTVETVWVSAFETVRTVWVSAFETVRSRGF